MNVSAHVDVVMAGGTPDHTPLDAGQPETPEQVDVSPDPHRRTIVLAPTKAEGYEEARALGIEPVAVITPRSLDAAQGIVADALMDSRRLTPEQRETLAPHAWPSLATTAADGLNHQ